MGGLIFVNPAMLSKFITYEFISNSKNRWSCRKL